MKKIKNMFLTILLVVVSLLTIVFSPLQIGVAKADAQDDYDTLYYFSDYNKCYDVRDYILSEGLIENVELEYERRS